MQMEEQSSCKTSRHVRERGWPCSSKGTHIPQVKEKNRYSDHLDANSRNNMTVHMKTIMGNIKIVLFLNITPFLCINYHLI